MEPIDNPMNRCSSKLVARSLALFLSLALGLPNSALALREPQAKQKAGLEQQILDALTSGDPNRLVEVGKTNLNRLVAAPDPPAAGLEAEYSPAGARNQLEFYRLRYVTKYDSTGGVAGIVHEPHAARFYLPRGKTVVEDFIYTDERRLEEQAGKVAASSPRGKVTLQVVGQEGGFGHPVVEVRPAAGLEETLPALPEAQATPGVTGVFANETGSGLAIGVALHRAVGIPAAFVTKTSEEAAGLEELGINPTVIFPADTFGGVVMAANAAAEFLAITASGQVVTVTVGVDRPIGPLAQLLEGLFGIRLPQGILFLWQGFIEKVDALITAA